MGSYEVIVSPYLTCLHEIIAKKIPIDQILASTRGGQRPGAASGNAGREGGVNLEENNAKGKDACNC